MLDSGREIFCDRINEGCTEGKVVLTLSRRSQLGSNWNLR